jgi:hypothetical protein
MFAVLAAALFLQACAQDAATDGSEASSAAAEQESAAPADGGDDTAEAEDEGAGEAAAGEIPGVDLSADFCTITNQLDESDIFDEEPENAEDFTRTAEQIKQIYTVLAEKAPEEITDDVQLVAETGTRQIDLANELVREAGGDPAQVLDNPEAAQQLEELDADGEFAEATERLDTWTEENC